MAGKRGSKNAIGNRGEKTIKKCFNCQEIQKPIRVISKNINKMIFECECGYKDRSGKEVII